MKREIKFRLWCANNNEWEKDLWAISQSGKIFHPIKNYTYNKANHILTQYTGLKDKNGKPIYEDDIVEYYGIIEKVEFKQSFCFCENGIAVHGYNSDYRDGEIIGNIYENEDLLDEK